MYESKDDKDYEELDKRKRMQTSKVHAVKEKQEQVKQSLVNSQVKSSYYYFDLWDNNDFEASECEEDEKEQVGDVYEVESKKQTRSLSVITLCLNKHGRPTLVLLNQRQCENHCTQGGRM